MKTINISDDLHAKLKKISDVNDMSIQNIISFILEKTLSNISETKEFEIDPKNIESSFAILDTYIKSKNLKEGDYTITVISEALKSPIIELKTKLLKL
jgi:predicted CopG family antitoxin